MSKSPYEIAAFSVHLSAEYAPSDLQRAIIDIGSVYLDSSDLIAELGRADFVTDLIDDIERAPSLMKFRQTYHTERALCAARKLRDRLNVFLEAFPSAEWAEIKDDGC